MIRDIATAVLRNEELGGGNFLVEFAVPDVAATMEAGQFFMLGIPGSEILLRRPFSVCGLPGTFDDGDDGRVQVLYKVIGRGTRLLSTLKSGAPLTVLGPLGRGFEVDLPDGVTPVFVAGGIGSAPFPALTRTLTARGPVRPRMFYGARTASDLPLLDWFRQRCGPLVVTTDDGSLGTRGLVTAPLAEFLGAPDRGAVELYACGPEPMLKETARLAREAGVACQLSLEAHMACGFGVCIGCVVPTRGGEGETRYERVCIEGPVMRAERLAW
jgi:dihydroorotate dehydrogenase electron transfer subunit